MIKKLNEIGTISIKKSTRRELDITRFNYSGYTGINISWDEFLLVLHKIHLKQKKQAIELFLNEFNKLKKVN